MAYVPEEATWSEGVYRLERSDPVLGGPGGVSNRPLEDLACRTVWLKQTVEALESSVGDTSDDVYERLAKLDEEADDIYSQILGLQRNVVNIYGMIDDVETSLDDLNAPKRGTLVLDAPRASGRTVTLPDGMKYAVGTNTLSVFWQGVKCAPEYQYQEGIADSDGYASTIVILFAMREGSLLEFDVAGHTSNTIDQDGGDPDGYISDIVERLKELENTVVEIQKELVMQDASEIFEETLEEK